MFSAIGFNQWELHVIPGSLMLKTMVLKGEERRSPLVFETLKLFGPLKVKKGIEGGHRNFLKKCKFPAFIASSKHSNWKVAECLGKCVT